MSRVKDVRNEKFVCNSIFCYFIKCWNSGLVFFTLILALPFLFKQERW